MTKNLVNAKIVLKLSDPWDLGENLGWKALNAIIYNVKNEDNKSTSIAIKLVSPFDYNNTHCEYFSKRDGVFTPSQRFWRGGMTGIAPKLKHQGRVE